MLKLFFVSQKYFIFIIFIKKIKKKILLKLFFVSQKKFIFIITIKKISTFFPKNLSNHKLKVKNFFPTFKIVIIGFVKSAPIKFEQACPMPAMITDQKGEQSWTCKIELGSSQSGAGGLFGIFWNDIKIK